MKSHCLNYLLHANLNLKSFIFLLLDCSSKLLIMMMSITTSAAATTTSPSSLDTLKMTDNEHQIKTSQSHGQLVLLQYWAKSSSFALPQSLGRFLTISITILSLMSTPDVKDICLHIIGRPQPYI